MNYHPGDRNDQLLLTEFIGTALKMDLPVSEALRVLVKDVQSLRFKRGLEQAAQELAKGRSFAEALSNRRLGLPDFFPALTRIGEQTNTLGHMFNLMRTLANRAYVLQQKNMSLSAYPMALAVMLLCIFGILDYFVLPKFHELFQEYGEMTHLPKFQFLYDYHGLWVLSFGAIFLAGAVWLGVLSALLPGAYRLGVRYWGPYLPWIGELYLQSELTLVLRVLTTLLRLGVDLEEGINACLNLRFSPRFEKTIQELLRLIKQHPSTTTSDFTKLKAVPITLIWLLSKSGNHQELTDCLAHVADFMDLRIETTLSRIGSIVEPIIILLVGGIICFIATALYESMFKLGEVFNYIK